MLSCCSEKGERHSQREAERRSAWLVLLLVIFQYLKLVITHIKKHTHAQAQTHTDACRHMRPHVFGKCLAIVLPSLTFSPSFFSSIASSLPMLSPLVITIHFLSWATQAWTTVLSFSNMWYGANDNLVQLIFFVIRSSILCVVECLVASFVSTS